MNVSPCVAQYGICMRRPSNETHGQADAITGNGHSLRCRSFGRGPFNLGWTPSSLSAGQESIAARLRSRRDDEKTVGVVPSQKRVKLAT
jgi:hypothetical protein